MRLTLRAKVMLIAVLPLAVLALTTLWVVNRSITDRVQGNIRDDLKRASAVFESMLASRSRTLEIETQTIAQDPKFFSVLTLPGANDPQVRATIAGVARDFNAITQSDLFEVLNAEGRPVASVGRDVLQKVSASTIAREALNGRSTSGIVSERNSHYQANATPVFAGGRVVGALLVGSRIGSELADQLRSFTRSEVTFLVGTTPTASTLDNPRDREALLAAVPDLMGTVTEGGAGTIAEVRAPHDVYLTLVRPIPDAPAGSRQCYVMQRSLDDETRFLRDVQMGLLGLGVIALIAAVLAGWVIADRIVAPVKQIVRGAEAMERGDYQYKLDVRRDDEIGYLAKRFEDMRQKQRAYVSSLQEAARVKSEFISLASHELRTPISVIKGYEELMLGETIGPITTQQRNALEAIRRSVGALARIAENATRMAQIESDRMVLEVEDADVSELLDQSLDAARTMGQARKVAIAARCEGVMPRLRFDRGRLGIALTHLITNGIRWTQDGGQVDVRARWDGRVLDIAVRDTGIGIPRERHAALLGHGAVSHDVRHHHSSMTLEFQSGGLGLGLSIARGIVEAHGGALTLESEVGHGSTFRMRLPLELADAQEAKAA